MTEFDKFCDFAKSHVHAVVKPESPPLMEEDGVWIVDITKDDKHIIVCWSKIKGFGFTDISDGQHGYGEGPGEALESLDAIKNRIVKEFPCG